MIQNINLSLGLDGSENMRGIRRSQHFVEDDVLAWICLKGRSKIEIHSCLGTDIEFIPVEVGALRSLGNIHDFGEKRCNDNCSAP